MHEELFYNSEWTFHGPSVIAPTTFDEDPLVGNGHFIFEGGIPPTLLTCAHRCFGKPPRRWDRACVLRVGTSGVSSPRLILHDLHYVFETQPVPSHPLFYWSPGALLQHSHDADDAQPHLLVQDSRRVLARPYDHLVVAVNTTGAEFKDPLNSHSSHSEYSEALPIFRTADTGSRDPRRSVSRLRTSRTQ